MRDQDTLLLDAPAAGPSDFRLTDAAPRIAPLAIPAQPAGTPACAALEAAPAPAAALSPARERRGKPRATGSAAEGADATGDMRRSAEAAAIAARIEVYGVVPGAALPHFEADLVLADPALLCGAAGIAAQSETLPPEGPELEACLARAGSSRVAVLVAGDPLLEGPGGVLMAALGPERVRLEAAPGAMQRALTRIGVSIDEVDFVSLDRVGLLGLSARLRRARLYAISPGDIAPQAIGRALEHAGYHQARVWLLEPAADAPVNALLAFELSDSTVAFGADTQVIVYTAMPDGSTREWPGIPAASLTDALPEAARLLALSWMQPGRGEIGWCIEPGEAAVALDWSRSYPAAEIHCVGIGDEELRAACARHAAGEGLRALPSGAFRCLEALPDPDVLFIRAGDEFTQQIRTGWARLAPGGRMVVAAEDEQSRQELMQFAARNAPTHWQDVGVAVGCRQAGRARLDPPRNVRLMAWHKPPRG